MLAAAIILLLVGFVAVLRARGGVAKPSGAERLYLALAAVPLILTILAPAVIGVVWGVGAMGRRWIEGLSWTGLVLSVVLGIMGAMLMLRAARRGAGWGWPLGAATVIAAAPAALVLLSDVLLRLLALR